ncbi:jerky protein homolog [Stegodyphus dumicola]|uniref:jerky protein homolog n=1 Tax=Stegodyphus dumicola TaxID=202533 RepID=UPI0015A81018|nr:jerky protein homolog [Stegodyphus dumicola]
MIVEKAKKFGQDLGVAESECNYSDGWLRNFKFRHGIRRLDVTGETLSANQNSAEKYKDEFEKIVADNDLTPEQIYNADETGLLWRCLPTSTLAGGGEKAAKGLLNADCDVTDFQKKFTVKDAVYAIAQSWNQVKNTTLQKCWRKLWPAANPASDLTLQTDEEENHQDALTKVLDVVRSTDNP